MANRGFQTVCPTGVVKKATTRGPALVSTEQGTALMRKQGVHPLRSLLVLVLSAAVTISVMTEPSVPAVPPALETRSGVSGLLNVWKQHLRLEKKAADPQVAESLPSACLVVAPQTHLFANMAPQGSFRHPLYMPSLASTALRRDVLLAAISATSLTTEQQGALGQPDGEVRVTNLKGEELLLKTDANGSLTVNGVPGKLLPGPPDDPSVVVVDDFLFDHRQRIDEVKQAGRDLR